MLSASYSYYRSSLIAFTLPTYLIAKEYPVFVVIGKYILISYRYRPIIGEEDTELEIPNFKDKYNRVLKYETGSFKLDEAKYRELSLKLSKLSEVKYRELSPKLGAAKYLKPSPKPT
ncbi:hypothetical protein QBC39DRAFT_327530 [Podospora conica]|nr:hypothetical protein QBC39DRAFT_327530 [Schizothecium conicum]